ncbi:MAG: integrase repeat-containing protein [Nitrosopumilus sp.]
MFCKSNKKPHDIPSVPRHQYIKEWKGLGDWLGTNAIAPQNKKFRTFKSAKKFVQSLNLKSYYEWLEYCKSNKKPHDIPSVPRHQYIKEWKGFGDWLGTNAIATHKKKFKTFRNARRFARVLKLHSHLEWVRYYKTHTLPVDIPTTPNRTYKDKGWIGWKDWLGTN